MNNSTNPRKENFCEFLKLTCCPTFTIFSFIVLICLFDLIYFLTELAISSRVHGEFLQPDSASLMKLGAKYPFNMKRGYVWLFITPCFMHASFMHIFGNTIATLIFGMSFETTVGVLRVMAIYFLSGIGGNLFSALITDDLSVGASTCIMGLLGGQLAFIILNWDALRPLGFLRCQMLCLISIIVLMQLLMGFANPSVIDNFGHFGGFLVGLLSSFVLLTPMEGGASEERLKKFNFVLLVLYFLIGFILFYTVRHPAEIVIFNGEETYKGNEQNGTNNDADNSN